MDNYFEWYDMYGGQQVWFAEMKLVDARLFWTNIKYQLERARQKPRLQGRDGEIQGKISPPNPIERLPHQWQSLRQGKMFVTDYSAKFGEYML